MSFFISRKIPVVFGGSSTGGIVSGQTYEYSTNFPASINPTPMGTCPTSAGLTPVLDYDADPFEGTTILLFAYNMTPGQPMSLLFSVTQFIPPQPLAPLGAPNCFLAVDTGTGGVTVPLGVASPSGSSTAVINIPAGTAGAVFYAQVLQLDPLANPLGLTLTNLRTGVVGALIP